MKTLITIFLGMIAISCHAQKQRLLSITDPDCIDIYNRNEKIDKVVTTKEGTTVFMSCHGDSATTVSINKNTYLVDEGGNHYRLKQTSGIETGKNTVIGKQGKLSFKLTFSPLPKGCTSFDLVQKGINYEICYLDIHQRGTSTKISKSVDTTGMNNELDRTFPDELFQNDSVHVYGQLKGLVMSSNEKCVISVLNPVPSLCGNKYTYEIHVNKDGRFNAMVPVCGPMWTELRVERTVEGKDYVSRMIPIFLYPKDNVEIVVENYYAAETNYRYTNEAFKDTKLLDLSKIFFPRMVKSNGIEELCIDSLKQTIRNSEMAACYLANKYKLSKTETALLISQANVARTCEALRIVNSYVLHKKYELYQEYKGSSMSEEQKLRRNMLNNEGLFGVLSELRAESKAFLVVPSMMELCREIRTSPVVDIDLDDLRYNSMPEGERILYGSELNIHQLRKFREKPLGGDRLFEQWFTLVSFENDTTKDIIIKKTTPQYIEEGLNLKSETITLPLFKHWKMLVKNLKINY